MKYKKEIIVIVLIFSMITILDIFTNRNTEKVMEKMVNDLDDLKEEISISEKYNVKKIDELESYWEEEIKVMSLYLEHNEIEKVNSSLAKLKANMDSKEKYMALENIEEVKFIIEHIKNKNILNLQNVF